MKARAMEAAKYATRHAVVREEEGRGAAYGWRGSRRLLEVTGGGGEGIDWWRVSISMRCGRHPRVACLSGVPALCTLQYLPLMVTNCHQYGTGTVPVPDAGAGRRGGSTCAPCWF